MGNLIALPPPLFTQPPLHTPTSAHPHQHPSPLSPLVAAAFQLAVQYESMDLPDEALRFFTKAGRPSYALRLALKLGDDVQVMQLAGQCSKSDRIEAARRLEEAGDLDRAVRLYQLGGHQGKALVRGGACGGLAEPIPPEPLLLPTHPTPLIPPGALLPPGPLQRIGADRV